jgi:hypothetical protein
MHIPRMLTGSAAIALIAGLAQAQAPSFAIVDLADQLPAGYGNSIAVDISESGVVFGNAYDPHGQIRVIQWSDGTGDVLVESIFGNAAVSGGNGDGLIIGTYIGTANGWTLRDGEYVCVPLPDPCGSFANIWRASSAEAINELGQFTGAISPQVGEPQWDPIEAYIGQRNDDGIVTITKLGDFNGEDTRGLGINELGDVVGWSGLSPAYTPLLFRDGDVIQLPTLGGAYNLAADINDNRIAVGHLWETTGSLFPYVGEGVLWDTSVDPITFELIGKLDGYSFTGLNDINEGDVAVGRASNGDDWLAERAILWYEGELYDLNDLVDPDSGWTLLVAEAINDDGTIVGYGVKDDEIGRRAVLLTMNESVGCRGDLDGDGFVGLSDLGTLLAAYGVDAGGDLDGDGDTDLADLGALLADYNQDC